jgi:3-hydroxy-9,10-secoandrosta-1,3,5(10)-triene-9,17-dione monooxygenase reductase component
VNPLEPGARIHSDDPFATPEPDRSPVRRLRGRLAGAVTLWTAPGPAAPGTAGPAGLTVSSMLVADGDPGRVLGLIDEESDLWDAVRAGGRFAVTVLGAGDQQLADRFAGLMPAPGGLFTGGAWTDTDFGPVPAGAGTWAGCRLESHRPCGWALLVEGIIETVRLDRSPAPLLHLRGRYRRLAD